MNEKYRNNFDFSLEITVYSKDRDQLFDELLWSGYKDIEKRLENKIYLEKLGLQEMIDLVEAYTRRRSEFKLLRFATC